MKEKTHIGILFGGRSGEYEVSLQSASSVISVIDPELFDITEIGITKEGMWLTGKSTLEAFKQDQFESLVPAVILPEPQNGMLYTVRKSPAGDLLEPITHLDVIFPVLHGTFGEDGTVQGLLELADIAYVSTGVLASSVGMDKALFKEVMLANQIPVVESDVFSRNEIEQEMEKVITRIESHLPYPVFVKPANLGSSVGISKCRSHSDLHEGLMEAAIYDRRILVERGVNAREIEVSILGNEDPKASIVGEIRPADEFYTYNAKYCDEASELIIPAPLDKEQAEQIRETAVRAFKAIDGAGMARVDFLLDRDSGKFYLSEVNTIPGFTKISMYPKLWEATGISYRELVQKLIQLAFDRKKQKDNTKHSYRRGE